MLDNMQAQGIYPKVASGCTKFTTEKHNYLRIGKTVYTFCTSGGSGIDESVSNLQSLYSSVNVAGGQRFEENASEDEISSWIDSLQ